MRKTNKRRNPQEVERIRKEEISDLEVAKKMLKIYQSAQDRKLDFDLSFESVKKLMTYPNCYYTNKKFEDEGLYARSFDRIDSSKGYVEGNVVSCTVDINGKKSNLSLEELELLYNKLIPKFLRNKTEPQPEEIAQPLSSPREDI